MYLIIHHINVIVAVVKVKHGAPYEKSNKKEIKNNNGQILNNIKKNSPGKNVVAMHVNWVKLVFDIM